MRLLLVFALSLSAFLAIYRGIKNPMPTVEYRVEVLTVAYESSNQSFGGQVAVASVIKTRMAERKQTAEEVVLAPYQFSCWNPKTQKPTQSRALSEWELKRAEKAWNSAEVGKFNHYCRYDVKPYWIKAAKSSKRVGSHVFYEL